MTAVPFAVVERALDLIPVLEAEESMAEVSRMRLAFGNIDKLQAHALVTQWQLLVGGGEPTTPRKPLVSAADLLPKRPRGMALVKVPKRG